MRTDGLTNICEDDVFPVLSLCDYSTPGAKSSYGMNIIKTLLHWIDDHRMAPLDWRNQSRNTFNP